MWCWIKPKVFEVERGFLRKHTRLLILQRLVSSRGAQVPRDPLACARGDKKKGARGDKKGLGATAGGLVQKHFYYSLVDLTDKHQEGAKIRKSFKGSIL